MKLLQLAALALVAGALGAFLAELLRPRRMRPGYDPVRTV